MSISCFTPWTLASSRSCCLSSCFLCLTRFIKFAFRNRFEWTAPDRIWRPKITSRFSTRRIYSNLCRFTLQSMNPLSRAETVAKICLQSSARFAAYQSSISWLSFLCAFSILQNSWKACTYWKTPISSVYWSKKLLFSICPKAQILSFIDWNTKHLSNWS